METTELFPYLIRVAAAPPNILYSHHVEIVIVVRSLLHFFRVLIRAMCIAQACLTLLKLYFILIQFNSLVFTTHPALSTSSVILYWERVQELKELLKVFTLLTENVTWLSPWCLYIRCSQQPYMLEHKVPSGWHCPWRFVRPGGVVSLWVGPLRTSLTLHVFTNHATDSHQNRWPYPPCASLWRWASFAETGVRIAPLSL